MERQLIEHLKACADAFTRTTGSALSTLGQRAAGDWRFFPGLDNPDTTFTVRKYDAVMQWFSDNWPPKTAWPKGVRRPLAAGRAA